MRLFNLTDIPTAQLECHNLVNKTLAVRAALISPGDSVETDDDVLTRRDAAHYVTLGALAVDVLPPAYAVAKDRLQRAEKASVEVAASKKNRRR